MNKKFKKNKNRQRAFNKYDPEKHPLPKVQEIAEEAQREVPTYFPGELEDIERQASREAREVEVPEVPLDPTVPTPPVVPTPDPNEVPTDPVNPVDPVEEPVEEVPLELPVEEEPPIENPETEVPLEDPVIDDRAPVEEPIDPETLS